MKIRLDELKDKTLELSAEEPIERFDVLLAMQGEVSFPRPLSIEVKARREFDHVRVDGHVSTAIKLACSRCLEEFETGIDSAFVIFYTEQAGQPMDEEIELSEKDLVSAYYQGNEIDLTPEIEEQVIMELPVKPLCREECKGLCPSCGAPLNRGECGCNRGDFNIKFSALKDLKLPK